MYYRPEPGVFIGESNGFIRSIGTYTENPYPICLRLERRGNTFYGYKSNNEGVTWTLVVTQPVNMSNATLVGLVTVGHDNALPNRAFYDATEAYQLSCWQVYVYGQPPQTQCYSYSL